MTENSCVAPEELVDYLYGEADEQSRRRVETHIRGCVRCAEQIGGLKEVRGTLEEWSPPDTELGFRVDPGPLDGAADDTVAAASAWARLRRMPAWGLPAAAVLILAAGVAIARPEVQIGQGGMLLRIGWTDASSSMTPSGSSATGTPSGRPLAPSGDELRRGSQSVRGTPVGTGGVGSGRQPMFGDATLEAGAGAVSPPASPTDASMQGVRQMILESEQRQDRALMTELRQLEQQLANRRQADLVEMERVFAELGEADTEQVRGQLREYLRRLSLR